MPILDLSGFSYLHLTTAEPCATTGCCRLPVADGKHCQACTNLLDAPRAISTFTRGQGFQTDAGVLAASGRDRVPDSAGRA